MNWLIGIVITLAALVVLAVAAGQLGFLQGKPLPTWASTAAA